jgi:hypothetical protein
MKATVYVSRIAIMMMLQVLAPIMDMPKLGNRQRSMARWNETPTAKRFAFPVRCYVKPLLSTSHATIVILNYREKEIARRIVVGFKQWICGFDILRVQEGHAVMSFVCDVNGWSFVKNSRCVTDKHGSESGYLTIRSKEIL